MTAATVSRWARRYALVAVVFLVAWQGGLLLGVPWREEAVYALSRRAEVVLALYGFVLHTVFGKAYSLVPTYFDREVAFPYAPAVQFPLVVGGTLGLLGAALDVGPAWLGTAGAGLWLLGVGTFLGTLGWTIRDNPTGAETATGASKGHLRPVDRVANAFVPVALLYLLAGSYEMLALHAGRSPLYAELPTLFGGTPAHASHALAAGAAGLLVLAIGSRLLPRFIGATLPRPLVVGILAPGAVGPLLLATHLWGGLWFRVGAILQAIAVVGFAVAVGLLYVRADRRRVGIVAVLAGAAAGVGGVALGVATAIGRQPSSFATAHLRLNLLGFLGLTIVGVAYQFYPPAAGRWPGASDRSALASIASLAVGLLAQVLGLLGSQPLLVGLGVALTFLGALAYGYLVTAVLVTRG